MAKKKKNRSDKREVEKLLLATAIINLLISLIEIIKKLIE